MALFRDNFRGLNGFEELRKYIKQGSEFCKEVALVLQERSDLEIHYAKNLQKLSAKLLKAASTNIGTLADGWKAVATLMEQEADLHKNLGLALVEEISKPLKQLVEAQTKARKPIEILVDKSLKNLTEKRTEEYKAKKVSFTCAKEYEKGEDNRNDAKSANKKSDKDKQKLEKKCDQNMKLLKKADKDYCELCEKAEASRQEWDLNVYKGSAQLQTLEEERISKMSEYLNQFNSHLSVMGPRMTTNCDRLNEAVMSVDLQTDLQTVVQNRGTGVQTSEQILIDCYAEDMQFSMKPDRRKNCLQNYLLFIRQSIERERKGREGVEKLIEVYQQRPGFADPVTQDETRQRLLQVTYMMNFLEASHYKIANAFGKLDGQQKLEHKFAQYIESNRDKQGMTVSTLKLPANMANEGNSGYDVTSVTLTTLDGQGNENETGFARRKLKRKLSKDLISLPFIIDEIDIPTIPSRRAEARKGPRKIPPPRPAPPKWAYLVNKLPHRQFDSTPDLTECSASTTTAVVHAMSSSLPNLLDHNIEVDYSDITDDEFEETLIGRCRALYNYQAQHEDELSIHEGDIINLYEKQQDGWWQGESGGHVGIFPATYVEEL